jgi:hypothetical protein
VLKTNDHSFLLIMKIILLWILVAAAVVVAADRRMDNPFCPHVRPTTAPPPCTRELLTKGLEDWLDEQAVWAHVIGGFTDDLVESAARRLRHRLLESQWTSPLCTPKLYPNGTAILDHDAFRLFLHRLSPVDATYQQWALDFDVDLCGHKHVCHSNVQLTSYPPQTPPPIVTCLGPTLIARVNIL